VSSIIEFEGHKIDLQALKQLYVAAIVPFEEGSNEMSQISLEWADAHPESDVRGYAIIFRPLNEEAPTIECIYPTRDMFEEKVSELQRLLG